MIAPQTGTILISAPSMDDPHFDKVVILLTEVNTKGATGFALNRLFERRFNELVEFRHSLPVPMYNGGPVETESLFFLHRRPDMITGSTLVTGDVRLGGNFTEAVRLINDKSILENEIRLFVGYSGWDGEQLKQEVNEGNWIVLELQQLPVFESPAGLWEKLYNAV
ncbi:MAG: YqgE/AlgH family protein [Chitinophagaceae bacterium]|nr:MAG: YqgE/AlgH family protein [Chitinophagaceae bacterium]